MKRRRAARGEARAWIDLPVRETDFCVIWPFSTAGTGYPQVTTPDKKSIQVHRYILERYKGPCPEGMILCHECDNQLCVNPRHMRWDTYKSNSIDARNRSRVPAQKLSMDDVIVIKALLRMGRRNARIAEDFGVSSSLVSRIKTGSVWENVG